MLLVILLRPKKCLQLLRMLKVVVILVITLWPRFSMCKVEALKENKTALGVLSRRLLPLPLSAQSLRWLHAGDRCKPRPRALRLRSRSSQFARLLAFL